MSGSRWWQLNSFEAPEQQQGAEGWRHWLADLRVLFGAVGVLMLVIIWSSTHYLVTREQAAIQRQVALSIVDVADTYEARVLRSLREIDATLKLVDLVASQQPAGILDTLQERDLLPPELIFSVSIVDAQGQVRESNSASGVAASVVLPSLSLAPGLFIAAFSNEGYEQFLFARVLSDVGHGSDPVWGILTVGADYFVSGYDSTTLGEQGVLAIVDAAHVARIARSGARLYSGVAMQLGVDEDALSREEVPFVSHWLDGERLTLVRSLYSFPLSIVVGISVDEKLASANAMVRRYWLRGATASLVALLILGVLAWQSLQLQRERQRVTDQRLRHAHYIEHLAFHDTLTNLPNRAHLSFLMRNALEQKQAGSGFALLFLDLDRFKSVNDSLGHEAGDRLLKLVAKRLVAAVREQDVVVRLGGDEFVILVRNVAQRELVARIASQLVATIQQPFALNRESCSISVSIGVAFFPDDGLDEQTLMKRADMAMYRAKQAGKNGVFFYAESS